MNTKVTPKDFFLWLGAMVAFYWSIVAFIFLTFDYINYAFPNALSYYPADPYQSGISYEMASIIVLLPVYILLMWLIRKDIVKEPSHKEMWVRRWALILTLFVAGIAIAGDLINLLTTFLNGEDLTTAFLFKTALIFLISAGVCMHFLADLKGYWDMFPKRRLSVVIGVAILAVVTIVEGFFIVGTPAHARLARFDAQKVTDLQNIQGRVESYFQAKQKLPETIADLNDPLTYGSLPLDPQTGVSYVYGLGNKGITTADIRPRFYLCATFNAESAQNQNGFMGDRATMPVPPGGKGVLSDTWEHSMGEVCFDRTLDPSFYPPSPKILPI